jgi:archaellum component FlaC
MSELAELKNLVSELKTDINTMNIKINNLNDAIDSKINDLNDVMDAMNDKLDKLLPQFEIQSTNCKKMSDHIEFVETVYEKVKHPLNYMINVVSSSSYAITEE